MSLIIEPIATDSDRYRQSVDLRRAVLRTPLGLDFTEAQLSEERDHWHLAAFLDQALVGTVILAPYGPDTLKLRQMAVAPSARGKGIGRALLKTAEALAQSMKARQIKLAARVSAQAFYLKNGYSVLGDVYTEVTIDHIDMIKLL